MFILLLVHFSSSFISGNDFHWYFPSICFPVGYFAIFIIISYSRYLPYVSLVSYDLLSETLTVAFISCTVFPFINFLRIFYPTCPPSLFFCLLHFQVINSTFAANFASSPPSFLTATRASHLSPGRLLFFFITRHHYISSLIPHSSPAPHLSLIISLRFSSFPIFLSILITS